MRGFVRQSLVQMTKKPITVTTSNTEGSPVAVTAQAEPQRQSSGNRRQRRAQAAYLREMKRGLAKKFPGYDPDKLIEGKVVPKAGTVAILDGLPPARSSGDTQGIYEDLAVIGNALVKEEA